MRYKTAAGKKMNKRTETRINKSKIVYAMVAIALMFICLNCNAFSAKNVYAAENYRMQKTTVVIKTGESYTAKILNNETKVSVKNFKWSSSDSKCAKVVNGKIYGLKPGSATITAQKNQQKISCEVFVCDKTEVVFFKKYKKQIKIKTGKTLILEPQKKGKNITYRSSDKTVATVSKTGKVAAKNVGSAKITCISYGTNRYVSEVEITVVKAAIPDVPTPSATPSPEPSVTPEITPTLLPDKPTPSVTPTPKPDDSGEPEQPKDFQKPLDGMTRYILHRGDQTVAPENSMPAFEAAGRDGAECVETDVRETADGVLVLSHDDSLQRMCGEDKLISEMTYEEVKQYPIINGKNASQYLDNVVPTLEEYLACCNKYSITPILEIKSIRTEQGMNTFKQLLSKSEKEPIIICFHINTLKKLRESGFSGKMQWIRTVRMTNSILQQCKKYKMDLSVEYKNISMDDINNAHQSGVRISVWLCQNEDMVDIFKKMGADYITYEKWNTTT